MHNTGLNACCTEMTTGHWQTAASGYNEKVIHLGQHCSSLCIFFQTFQRQIMNWIINGIYTRSRHVQFMRYLSDCECDWSSSLHKMDNCIRVFDGSQSHTLVMTIASKVTNRTKFINFGQKSDLIYDNPNFCWKIVSHTVLQK